MGSALFATSRIIDALKDGKGHGIREIAKGLRIPEERVLAFTRLLEAYGFFQYNSETEKVEVDPSFLRLLRDEEEGSVMPISAQA